MRELCHHLMICWLSFISYILHQFSPLLSCFLSWNVGCNPLTNTTSRPRPTTLLPPVASCGWIKVQSLVCFGFHLLSVSTCCFLRLFRLFSVLHQRKELIFPAHYYQQSRWGGVLECSANIRAPQHLKQAVPHHRSSMFLRLPSLIFSLKLKLSSRRISLGDPLQNLQSGSGPSQYKVLWNICPLTNYLLFFLLLSHFKCFRQR